MCCSSVLKSNRKFLVYIITKESPGVSFARQQQPCCSALLLPLTSHGPHGGIELTAAWRKSGNRPEKLGFKFSKGQHWSVGGHCLIPERKSPFCCASRRLIASQGLVTAYTTSPPSFSPMAGETCDGSLVGTQVVLAYNVVVIRSMVRSEPSSEAGGCHGGCSGYLGQSLNSSNPKMAHRTFSHSCHHACRRKPVRQMYLKEITKTWQI